MQPILSSQINYVYILDSLSASPLMAFSVRKLISLYSGNCLRIRRSSDNSELDIGFIGGSMDLASAINFVGSNSGFITTWYDQTGNNLHATQSTAANQPYLISSGVVQIANQLPIIYCYPSADIGLTTGSVNFGVTARSSFIVKKVLQSSGSLTLPIWPVSGNANANQSYDEIFPPNVSADEYDVNQQGTNVIIGVQTPNSHQLEQMTLRYGRTSKFQELFRNGISLGTGTATQDWPNIVDQIHFGSFPSAIPNIYMSEFIAFNTAISDGDKSTYEQNSKSFYGL